MKTDQDNVKFLPQINEHLSRPGTMRKSAINDT